MTKRSGNYNSVNGIGKKPKLEDDESWPDDDFDPVALEECFELATQLTQVDVASTSQLHNCSIVPNYSTFRNPSGFSSSTQVQPCVCAPSTSRKLSVQELEIEIQQLKDKNNEKDGEISILRSKIKETASNVRIEQQKTASEWREKFLTTQKDLKSVQSVLEFKNLEVANLKQQLADSRRLNQEAASITQITNSPKTVVKVNHERVSVGVAQVTLKGSFTKSQATEAIVEKYYPLKLLSPDIFDSKSTESHIIKNMSIKTSRNTIPYLQNQQNNESNFDHKCPRLDGKKIGLDTISCDIIKIINSDSKELNEKNCTKAVHKIVSVVLILLDDLNGYLVELGGHLRAEDVHQSDMNYLLRRLKKTNLDSKYSQLGNQASKLLHILATLLPYNTELIDFVCRDKALRLLNCKDYARLIPHRNGAIQKDYYLLRLLLKIVENIGKYRLADQTAAFLISTTRFLRALARHNGTENRMENNAFQDLFCKIFKEIVLVRPGSDVIEEITFLLKICSQYTFFTEFLFKKNQANGLLKSGPKGVLYANADVCCFCALAILMQNYLLDVDQLPLEVNYNMLNFVYNTYKTSHWIHHESEEKVCVCVDQLYKIGIEFAFRGFRHFIGRYLNPKHKLCITDEWSGYLDHEIMQKVLGQMNFANYDQIEKYVMVFSQCRTISRGLSDNGITGIPQFNAGEELPNISQKNFNKDF